MLEEHLNAQCKLIDETKSVVTQQATALDSQGKVVETALKYSESFDPSKLEGIIRRELDIDHKTQLENLKKEFADQAVKSEVQTQEKLQSIVVKIIDVATDAGAQTAVALVKPLIPHVINSLISLPKNERDAEIALLPEPMRMPLATGIDTIEAQAGEQPSCKAN